MSSSKTDTQRPWLGLDSYTEETREFFHGRDDEVAELSRRVQRKLLTVLFGQSGLGKTSILRAGLVPKLRPEGYCPIYVRIDYSPGGPSPTEQIKRAVVRVTKEAGNWSKPGASQQGESLWEFLHHRDDVLTDSNGRVLTPLLIFDQFEEVFTVGQTDDSGRARARAFLLEFADLIENRAPPAIEDNEKAAERFDFARADYRVLIALREDYLAHLERLRDFMPSITQNRVGISRMTASPALEAVLKPGGGLVSDEVARQIVRFVAGVEELTNAEIEPSLLSLVCRELNEVRIARGQPEISADLLEGSRETILGEFYERSISDQPEGVRHFIEDQLLTDSGYRESLAEERAQKACVEAGAPNALTTLVDRRLLRIEERLDVRRVELTHDVLCGVVKASRAMRQEREAKERAERELAATRAKEAATHRAMWRARIVALGAAILCVFAIGSAIFGYRNMVRAREQERIAHTIAYSSGMIVARQVLDDSNLGRTKTILDNQRPKPGEPDLRGWEWRYLWGQTRSDAESTLYEDPQGGEINSLEISPDGRLAAIGTYHGGGVVVIDLATREIIAAVDTERQRSRVAFSPTEPLLAIASVEFENEDPRVKLWNTQTHEFVMDWTLELRCFGLAFSDDGQRLITVTAGLGVTSVEGSIAIWNVADGSKRSEIPAPRISSQVGTNFAVTADLQLAAYNSPGDGGEIQVVDAPTGTVRWTAAKEQPYVLAMTFSPDGSILATAEGFGPTDVKLWDVASGQLAGRLHGHEAWVGQIVFWPDGSKLATVSADQTIRTWDVASRAEIDVMRGHENEVWRLALLPDNQTIISGSKDGVVALWDTSKLHPRQARIDWPKPVRNVAWSTDGRSLATINREGQIERWSGSGLVEVTQPGSIPVTRTRTHFSQGGTLLAYNESEEMLAVWNLVGDVTKTSIPFPLPDEHVDFVFGGRNSVLVHQGNSELFQEMDLATGKAIQTWSWAAPGARSLASDGRLLIDITDRNVIVVRDLDSQSSREVQVDLLETGETALSPDGSLFAASSRIGYVRVWDTATWQEVVTLRGFILGAQGVAFSSDGTRLVASDGSGNQAVRLWDTASWQEVLTLKSPGSLFNWVSFSPDGNRIAAASDDGIIHLWEAPSWEEIDRAERGTLNAELSTLNSQ